MKALVTIAVRVTKNQCYSRKASVLTCGSFGGPLELAAMCVGSLLNIWELKVLTDFNKYTVFSVVA